MKDLRCFLWLLLLAATALGQTPAAPASPGPVTLTADTPETTVFGNSFIAPTGWTLRVQGPATIIAAPEADSWIALVDVEGKDAEAAVVAAWQVYKANHEWPLKVANDAPDKDGWSKQRVYEYQTSPNEKRGVQVSARFANGRWTVVILDMSDAVAEKRLAQVALVTGRLLPKGYVRETFAGKKANRLDEARLAELKKFVETGQKELGIPGVGLGIIQDGKVIFAGGLGVKSLGEPASVDGDTLFMIASNTKALTTLLLARLVAQGKLNWDTPVTSVLPSFKLGDADTTRQVRIRQLICACTGLPRQDFEWLFNYARATPSSSLAVLATMQPTSRFGEVFQYSNLMA
ncbi:MAG TPA: serine hydrolase domain-containing protein, partial [Thermoanaerobaculia bacterium]